MSKTPEEKAREYAGITPDVKNVNNLPETFSLNKIKYQTYLDVYHSRDEEVKELREALKEIVKQVPRCNFNLSTSTSYSEANRLDELIVKAKQLIEEE